MGPEESEDAENDEEEEEEEGEGEVTAEDEWRAQVDRWMNYIKGEMWIIPFHFDISE